MCTKRVLDLALAKLLDYVAFGTSQDQPSPWPWRNGNVELVMCMKTNKMINTEPGLLVVICSAYLETGKKVDSLEIS